MPFQPQRLQYHACLPAGGGFGAAFEFRVLPATCRKSDASAAALVADGHVAAFDDDRHLALSIRGLEHFLHLVRG